MYERDVSLLGEPSALVSPDLDVGSFRFWFVGQTWERSHEVVRMHGYDPGEIVPTTELLLSHKHPDDRQHVQDALDHALLSRGSFSSRHRFIDHRRPRPHRHRGAKAFRWR